MARSRPRRRTGTRGRRGRGADDRRRGQRPHGELVEIQPGFGTGWVTHGPAIAVVTNGTISYYEARHGACVVSESWGAGQAYVHHADRHVHMAVDDGAEPVALTVVYLNLPHEGLGAVPVVGNTLDAYDFTPTPPAGCPRLR